MSLAQSLPSDHLQQHFHGFIYISATAKDLFHYSCFGSNAICQPQRVPALGNNRASLHHWQANFLNITDPPGPTMPKGA
jgi:hypothetical protein